MQFCIPSDNAPGLQFLHILANTNFSGFFIFFFIVAILTGVRCYAVAVLICMSLLTGDVEHLFMCLLAIRLSFLAILCSILCRSSDSELPQLPIV